ncbi:MAG: CHRD domain-containing protein [Planctomycetota bacterium]
MKHLFLLCWLMPIPVSAQTAFVTSLDASQVVNNPSNSPATGIGTLRLNAEQTELAYSVQLFGVDLEPEPGLRTDPNDVIAIHIHLHVQDVIGPHILNIFGNPSEDDADLVIDYENDSFSGVFDASDASRDPVTGQVLPQAFPLTTKLFPTPYRLEELLNDEWYFAVHTVGSAATPPGVTIRGAIQVVPEPQAATLLLVSLLGLRRQRSLTHG